MLAPAGKFVLKCRITSFFPNLAGDSAVCRRERQGGKTGGAGASRGKGPRGETGEAGARQQGRGPALPLALCALCPPASSWPVSCAIGVHVLTVSALWLRQRAGERSGRKDGGLCDARA